ncbi:MAG TPA: MFS transporter [Candidatus Acidoferrales bacterium]
MTRRRLSRNVRALGVVAFFNDLSSEMIYWVLPYFVTSVLGAGPLFLGLIESVAESVAGFSKLLSGYLADRWHRRKPMVVAGYLLANVAKPLLALVQSWSQVFAIRSADRFGKGMRAAPRDLMIAESSEPGSLGSAFGFRQAMDSAGAIAGPLLALVLLATIVGDLRHLFLLAAIPGLFSVFLVAVRVRETSHAPRPRTGSGGEPAGASLGRRYYLLLAATALFGLANSSDLLLILRAQNLGMQPALAPALGLVFNSVYALAAWPAGYLSDRMSRKRVIALGYFLFALVYCGFAVGPAVRMVWALFALYGLYYALTEGVVRALVAELVTEGNRGRAYGLMGFVSSLSLLCASTLAGWLWQHYGPGVPFYFSSGVSFLAVLLILLI